MKIALSIVALGICSTTAGLARAQPSESQLPIPTYGTQEAPTEKTVGAPKDAFELSFGTGYTQGFGNLKGGVGLPSVVTPGAAFDLGLGYRIDPHWAVLWSGQYAELTAERTSTARSFTTGLAAQYHFAPTQPVDPGSRAESAIASSSRTRALGPIC